MSRKMNRAFTLTELVVVIATVAILFSLYLMVVASKAKTHRGHPIRCISNLKQVGLAFRIFANENDDKYPFEVRNMAEPYTGTVLYHNLTNAEAWMHFQVLSNELQNARIIACPEDSGRWNNSAEDFLGDANSLSSLRKRNNAVSYFIGLNADEAMPQSIVAGDRNLSPRSSVAPFSSSGTGAVQMPAAVWWSRAPGHQIHRAGGHVLVADGSVQLANDQRISSVLGATNSLGAASTNLFLFPQ